MHTVGVQVLSERASKLENVNGRRAGLTSSAAAFLRRYRGLPAFAETVRRVPCAASGRV